MNRVFSYMDEDECISCGACNFRESSVPGLCVECNPSGGPDDRKHKNEIIVKNNHVKFVEEEFI